jgi:hypothetical protein
MCTQYLHCTYTLSPPSPHYNNIPLPFPRQDLFHPPVLQFYRRQKKKGKKKKMTFLLKIKQRKFPCDIITLIGSSSLFFFILP